MKHIPMEVSLVSGDGGRGRRRGTWNPNYSEHHYDHLRNDL